MGSISHQKISTYVLLLLTCGLLATSSQIPSSVAIDLEDDGKLDDLDKAESKDSKNLEIIKQIRRLNDDGSYTVGYEAEDGTFKIESRDVLGNVKGTYGYVDANGEIKRVSYTANNATTGLRSSTTMQPPSTTTEEEVVQIPRQNRTGFAAASTTRRPSSLAFLTSTASSPTKTSVIQPIPKKRILISSSSDRPAYNQGYTPYRPNDYTTAAPRKGEPTTTVVYATSLPSQKSVIHIRPTPLPNAYKSAEQLSRPDKLEITDHVSKVQISNNRETSTSKPVIEDSIDDGESERKNIRGNFLRRQLSNDNEEKFEAQQQVIYSQSAGEDSSHIYGGVSGTVRPLFTTGTPRIPSLVLAARSRAAQLQNAINNNNAQSTSTNEKVYVKPPRRRPQEEEDSEPTTDNSSETNYITQGPVTVQIPANRDDQQATEGDKRVYRRPVGPYPPQFRNSREFQRQAPPTDVDYGGPRQFRIPIPQAYPQQYPQGYAPRPSGPEEPEQYLRETTVKGAAAAAGLPYGDASNEQIYSGQRGRQYLPYRQESAESGYEQQQQSLPIPYPQNPYSPYNRPPPPSQYYNNPDRPLTARDFERLLNLLVVRHSQLQRYSNYNPNPYGGYNNPYGQFGYQQIPRPPIYNPYNRFGGYNQPYGQYSDQQENMYQAQNQIPDQQVPYAGQRIVPRKKQYDPRYFGYQPRPEYSEASQPIPAQQTGDYLPPDVREELLYRMLLLAMQPGGDGLGSDQEASSPEYVTSPSGTTTTTATKSPTTKYNKPVRSVQILGEE